VTVRQLDGNDAIGLMVGEQRLGQNLDRHWGRPLAHADQDGSVPDDVDVATLKGGRLVQDVVVPVVHGELGLKERCETCRSPGYGSDSRWRAVSPSG